MTTKATVSKKLGDPFAMVELRIAIAKHRQLIGDETFKMWTDCIHPKITLVKQATLAAPHLGPDLRKKLP